MKYSKQARTYIDSKFEQEPNPTLNLELNLLDNFRMTNLNSPLQRSDSEDVAQFLSKSNAGSSGVPTTMHLTQTEKEPFYKNTYINDGLMRTTRKSNGFKSPSEMSRVKSPLAVSPSISLFEKRARNLPRASSNLKKQPSVVNINLFKE